MGKGRGQFSIETARKVRNESNFYYFYEFYEHWTGVKEEVVKTSITSTNSTK